jgi:hypothetical protein
LALHLVKLCVGCDTVAELRRWREETRRPGQPWILRTRQTPRRAGELLDGGSLFRVYKGFILSRQRILAVDTVEDGAARRCEIALSEEVVLTAPAPRRAFQGWRYLTPADAPPDASADRVEDGGMGDGDPTIRADLERRLKAIGAW